MSEQSQSLTNMNPVIEKAQTVVHKIPQQLYHLFDIRFFFPRKAIGHHPKESGNHIFQRTFQFEIIRTE